VLQYCYLAFDPPRSVTPPQTARALDGTRRNSKEWGQKQQQQVAQRHSRASRKDGLPSSFCCPFIEKGSVEWKMAPRGKKVGSTARSKSPTASVTFIPEYLDN